MSLVGVIITQLYIKAGLQKYRTIDQKTLLKEFILVNVIDAVTPLDQTTMAQQQRGEVLIMVTFKKEKWDHHLMILISTGDACMESLCSALCQI